ncbi:MAG: hypothetical protein M5U34_01315 [Chloroflexi bacterium]|nr:hypothetical protein [Chloroflexota bacterium]
MITAIESLSPGSRSSVQSPDARLYNLLQLRYIEGITVQEAANRMGLSARQAHRSLLRGKKASRPFSGCVGKNCKRKSQPTGRNGKRRGRVESRPSPLRCPCSRANWKR